jgi:serine/threonine-protein kinase RsbW
MKVKKLPHRKVFLNEKFYPLLKMIYDHVGLDREIILVGNSENPAVPEGLSVVNTTVKPDLNIAVIMVHQLGSDAVALVSRQLRELCLKKIETIYLEMPLGLPYSAVMAMEMNKVGFMLSGIIPELRDGDVLKMQYLNNVYVDPAKIVIASDLTKQLLSVIMQDYR